MLTISEIEPWITNEFGSRLTSHGFKQISKRKWVRSSKSPLRELFTIGRPIAAQYFPIWGISSGMVPAYRGQAFKRQSTDKNAAMDLIIDPVDISGNVPAEAFVFIPGYHTEIPKAEIRTCANHFVPRALGDFDRVATVKQFCEFFLERSRLNYRRFTFDMYLAHRLTGGFVSILKGRKSEGIEEIRDFCKATEVDFHDKILLEYIQQAQMFTRITV